MKSFTYNNQKISIGDLVYYDQRHGSKRYAIITKIEADSDYTCMIWGDWQDTIPKAIQHAHDYTSWVAIHQITVIKPNCIVNKLIK